MAIIFPLSPTMPQLYPKIPWLKYPIIQIKLNYSLQARRKMRTIFTSVE